MPRIGRTPATSAGGRGYGSAAATGELLNENAHDHVVVPGVTHVCRLSFPALLDESASPVAANRSLVESKYAEIDAVQS